MLASATQDLEEGRSQPLVTAVHYRYRCGAYSRCLALGVCESEARPIDSIMEQQFSSSRLLNEHGGNLNWMSV
jgi:hypothetical protein